MQIMSKLKGNGYTCKKNCFASLVTRYTLTKQNRKKRKNMPLVTSFSKWLDAKKSKQKVTKIFSFAKNTQMCPFPLKLSLIIEPFCSSVYCLKENTCTILHCVKGGKICFTSTFCVESVKIAVSNKNGKFEKSWSVNILSCFNCVNQKTCLLKLTHYAILATSSQTIVEEPIVDIHALTPPCFLPQFFLVIIMVRTRSLPRSNNS